MIRQIFFRQNGLTGLSGRSFLFKNGEPVAGEVDDDCIDEYFDEDMKNMESGHEISKHNPYNAGSNPERFLLWNYMLTPTVFIFNLL